MRTLSPAKNTCLGMILIGRRDFREFRIKEIEPIHIQSRDFYLRSREIYLNLEAFQPNNSRSLCHRLYGRRYSRHSLQSLIVNLEIENNPESNKSSSFIGNRQFKNDPNIQNHFPWRFARNHQEADHRGNSGELIGSN